MRASLMRCSNATRIAVVGATAPPQHAPPTKSENSKRKNDAGIIHSDRRRRCLAERAPVCLPHQEAQFFISRKAALRWRACRSFARQRVCGLHHTDRRQPCGNVVRRACFLVLRLRHLKKNHLLLKKHGGPLVVRCFFVIVVGSFRGRSRRRPCSDDHLSPRVL
jgi:hypothetical protein